MSSSLAGRKGLVVGVSHRRSAGFAIANSCQNFGATVIVSSRSESGERLASASSFEHVRLDTLDESSVASAFAEIERRHGRLDFLAHTLVSVPDGVLHRPLTEVTAAEFNAVMESSVRSLIVCVRYAKSLLRRSESPRVMSLMSAGGEFAIPNYHLVGVAKAALKSTLHYLAAELGAEGVLVNGLNFSIQSTAAAERVIGSETTLETLNHITRRSMTRSATTLEQVGDAAAYLLSPQCQNMTAEVLNVDGGFCRNYF